jgi:hypothetical protein
VVNPHGLKEQFWSRPLSEQQGHQAQGGPVLVLECLGWGMQGGKGSFYLAVACAWVEGETVSMMLSEETDKAAVLQACTSGMRLHAGCVHGAVDRGLRPLKC